jgi:hypothetical protein
MKNKLMKSMLIGICLALSCIYGSFAADVVHGTVSVSVSVIASHLELSFGDTLVLKYILTNYSNRGYSFSLLNNTGTKPLKFRFVGGKKPQYGIGAFIDYRMDSEKGDYYTLWPGQEKVFTYELKLIKRELHVPNVDKKNGRFLQWEEEGVFIDLEENHELLISGVYDVTQNDSDSAKNFEINDFYQGVIESQAITVRLK